MLGYLTLGFFNRSAKGVVFVCGNCQVRSEVSNDDLPAAISWSEIAHIRRCPECRRASKLSVFEFDSAPLA